MLIRSAITEIASVCPNSFITQGKSTVVVSIYSIIKSVSPSASAQSSSSSSEALCLSICVDLDSLVLHDMHKRKCMVIALNYTHTSERQGSSVEQPQRSNSRTSGGARATSDGSVVGVRCGCKSLCGFITYGTHPYSVGSKDGGSVSGADFHTVTWKCARKTFSLNASLVGGTVFITCQHTDARY